METLLKGFQSILNTVLDLLPDSPFRPFIDNLANIPYIGYLNYFIPINDFINILTAWGIAITLFYAVNALLRFIHAID